MLKGIVSTIRACSRRRRACHSLHTTHYTTSRVWTWNSIMVRLQKTSILDMKESRFSHYPHEESPARRMFMQKIEQVLTIKERIAVREAQRPQEFQGYITGLMELWLKVLGGPRNIVELGTYTGNSTFAWLACPNTFVTTIDNGPVENARPLREDVERYDWTGRVNIVHADSIEYASQY